MKQPHHGYVAYMAMALIAALQPPPLRIVPDPRKANPWQGYHKATAKKRGKKRGKGRK